MRAEQFICPRPSAKKSKSPASVKRKARNGSGDASLSAPLTTTNVQPQINVTTNSSNSAHVRLLIKTLDNGHLTVDS